MATQGRSPSLIIGQQWSALADFMSSSTENDDEDPDKDENKNSCDSMKLGRQDMSLFGFCPSHDEFSLVVCEKCNLLVKPQALKQHIESRHGPTNLSSLGSISASALNSELGKKLLMPLPIKPTPPPAITSSEKQTGGTFKPLRPPTKASLKQVPVLIKSSSTPILGAGVKINLTKPVKSRNRITSTTKTVSPAISNPVVKMEKLQEPSNTLSTTLCKPIPKKEEPLPTKSELSKNIHSLNASKISTLLNGSIKSATSLTTPSSTLTTTSPSMVSTPMLIAITKTSTDTPLSSRNVTTFVNTTTITKPLMIAPIMTIGSTGSLTLHPASGPKIPKVPKSQKERKFLPCKDREYDANKHCGVTVAESNKPCTRSLTCKTHALSLRRAVSGRSKSFDELLKEHKAAKDALLKAKAESQNATAAANAAASANRVLVSPATISSTLNALKQQISVISQFDGKVRHPGLTNRAVLSSNVMPAAAATPFVKPQTVSNVFQRFMPTAVLPPAITVKEQKSGTLQESLPKSLLSPLEVSAPLESKVDHSFFSNHPRPLASNCFGGRLNDNSCILFSRKMDYVRAALLSALERQLNPPPHKKLCVESNLPKESQVFSSSQDPYEFNLVDTSGCGGGAINLSPLLTSSTKPTIKPKSKVPTSPVTPSAASNQSLNILTGNTAVSLSVSASPLSSLTTTPIEVSSMSQTGLTLNWPIKSWDGTVSSSPNVSQTSVLSSVPITKPVNRKRSGSSGVMNSQLVALASGNGTLSSSSAVSLTMASNNAVAGTCQPTGLVGILTPTSLNSHQAGNLIAIPNVNLSSASLGQRSVSSTLGPSKITTPQVTSHKNNNIFKDFNLVLTGIEPSLVNGQYVNITGAQLTELAAGQGQTLFLNNFNPSGPTCTATSGTTFGINLASSAPSSRPTKRSRSSGSKGHQALTNSEAKIPANAFERYKLIPAGSVITTGSLPANAVMMDGGKLQDTMLTLATGGTTPTLVAIATSTANTSSSMVTGNIQALSTDTPTINTSSALVNGVIQSSYDKSGNDSQRHHHSSSTSSSKPHHHHHHHHHHHQQHHKTQHQPDTLLSSVLQTAPSTTAPPPLSGATPQLCSNPTIFRQGGTLNLAAKSLEGKLSIQPVSLTFPITVSQAGLAALTSTKAPQLQQQLQQQPQHTLLVSTGSGSTPDIDPAAVLKSAKTDHVHLQSQMANSSTTNLIS